MKAKAKRQWIDQYLLVVLAASIFVLGTFSACELENPEEGVAIEDIINISAASDSLLANGEATLPIMATLGSEAAANQLITFTTTHGTFIGGNGNTISVQSSGKTAEVVLQSSNEAENEVFVTASIAGFTQNTSLTFSRSYPDTIQLNADKLSLLNNLNDVVSLSVNLYRINQVGIVSNETPVFFEITSADSIEVVAEPFLLANGSTATNTIKSANGVTGLLSIAALSYNQELDTIRSNSIQINVIE